MKFRKGFVTNSSSSSFVCQICGCAESAFDITMAEAGFVECENEHKFCEEHILYPDHEEWEEYTKTNEYWRYDLSEKYCPICQMQELSDSDLIDYVAIKGLTRKKILQDIRDSFRTYKDFQDFLNTFSEGELYHEGTVWLCHK